MASDYWSRLVFLWQLIELDPDAEYEVRSVAPVPQFGGGEIDIINTAKFVKETPCGSARNDQRCVHFHSHSVPDKAQVRKILQSIYQKAGETALTITGWDQQIKMEIVVEKKTMLPQQLKITRFHNLTLNDKTTGRNDGGSEEFTTTYTFSWH